MKVIETALLQALLVPLKRAPGLLAQPLQHFSPLPRLRVHGALTIPQLLEPLEFRLKRVTLGHHDCAASQCEVQLDGGGSLPEFLAAEAIAPLEFRIHLCDQISRLLDPRLQCQ